MTFIIDNLIAIVVGTVLLVGLLVVQQRGQQRAVEASTRYRTQQLASGFVATLQRDIENGRSHSDTNDAFEQKPGSSMIAGSVTTQRFSVVRSADGTYTERLTFPTLADPERFTASAIQIVHYFVEPTGETREVGGVARPVLRATRYVYPRGGPIRVEGGVGELVGFDVTAFAADGSAITDRAWVDPVPARIQFEVEMAVDLPEQLASDQASGSDFASTRHARTVRVASAATRGGSSAVDATEDGGIPPFRGEAGYAGPSPDPKPKPKPPRPDPEPDPVPDPKPDDGWGPRPDWLPDWLPWPLW